MSAKGSTGYGAKFAALHSSSEGEIAGLELERQPPMLAAAQTELDQRIAQLTALLEQADANVAEAAKRAGLHADRLLMQTSLVGSEECRACGYYASEARQIGTISRPAGGDCRLAGPSESVFGFPDCCSTPGN